MRLLDHVSITVREMEPARRFCKGGMAALDAEVACERAGAIGFGTRNRAGDDAHTYVSVVASPAA